MQGERSANEIVRARTSTLIRKPKEVSTSSVFPVSDEHRNVTEVTNAPIPPEPLRNRSFVAVVQMEIERIERSGSDYDLFMKALISCGKVGWENRVQMAMSGLVVHNYPNVQSTLTPEEFYKKADEEWEINLGKDLLARNRVIIQPQGWTSIQLLNSQEQLPGNMKIVPARAAILTPLVQAVVYRTVIIEPKLEGQYKSIDEAIKVS